MQGITYQKQGDNYAARFSAMACPCEIIIASGDRSHCEAVAQTGANEVWRIESKFSRYQEASVLSKINASSGKALAIDAETYRLLQYAQQLYSLSDGMFDISSGVLQALWPFHAGASTPVLPSRQAIDKLLEHVGFERVQLVKKSNVHPAGDCQTASDYVILPEGMQLDFGGFAKEYAADCALQKIREINNAPVLINLGGDIVASKNPVAWRVGIKASAISASENVDCRYLNGIVSFKQGALATSGTSARRWLINKRLYSHILNPKTGWPIDGPPESISVFSTTCLQAGMYATLAMLQGRGAQGFIRDESLTAWLQR